MVYSKRIAVCYSAYSSKPTDISVTDQFCSASDAENGVEANTTCDHLAPHDK
jgi:hypothetical protein